jgi:osmotically-inducible protein OsmY
MSTEVGTGQSQDSVRGLVDVETSEFAVTVERGVVALSARVRCCVDGLEEGMRELRPPGLVDEVLEVHAPMAFRRIDVEIACNAAAALRRALPYSCEHARVTVKDAWVTVAGELEWGYQRERIRNAIATIPHIRGVSDHTTVGSHVDPNEIRRRIQQAYGSDAQCM